MRDKHPAAAEGHLIDFQGKTHRLFRADLFLKYDVTKIFTLTAYYTELS